VERCVGVVQSVKYKSGNYMLFIKLFRKDYMLITLVILSTYYLVSSVVEYRRGEVLLDLARLFH
jgi:hypothetical protein